jgi:hypothetical protein
VDKKELPERPDFEAEEEEEKERERTKTIRVGPLTTKTPFPLPKVLTDAELDAIDMESDIDTFEFYKEPEKPQEGEDEDNGGYA